MQCPHCGIDFHPPDNGCPSGDWPAVELPYFVQNPGKYPVEYARDSERIYWTYTSTACTKCREPIIELIKSVWRSPLSPTSDELGKGLERAGFVEQWRQRIYPRSTNRPPVPQDVPDHIAGDYKEACLVLADSPKASAALSRRCLQAMLSEQGYTQRNLVDQIAAVLNEQDRSKILPGHLRDAVDAVRQFGNFSAHPMTDKTTLQIIDVEQGEAKWCLDIIEELFNYYYVDPKRLRA